MALLNFYTPVRTSFKRNDVYNHFDQLARYYMPANGCYYNDGDMLSTNISESDAEFKIKMALPGISKENIKISVEKGILSVSLEAHNNEEESSAYTYREFDVPETSRSFRLGEKVNAEKISAEFKDGILTLTLKKREEFIPGPAREITVE